MTQKNKDKLDSYYKKAGTWAEDQRRMLASSRRTAWIIAGVAVVIALTEAIALALLIPFKTVVPYTLLVDRQTGNVQSLAPLESSKIAPDTALTQSFVVQYVLARENFDYATVRDNYRKVWHWSAEAARQEYTALMQAGNPASPLITMPRGSSVDTQVRSISPLPDKSFMVRFDTVTKDSTGREKERRHWVSIISYRYSQNPMTMEERFINPLGFEVIRYKRSAEAPPQPIETIPRQSGDPTSQQMVPNDAQAL